MQSPHPAEVPAIGRVGVVGAGQMGNGIAHVCSLAGLPVVLLDVKPDALDKALAVMGRNMDRQVARKLITEEEKAEALGRIATSTDYAAFGDCDLVIEAATEQEETKRAIFRALTPHLRDEPVHVGERHHLLVAVLLGQRRGRRIRAGHLHVEQRRIELHLRDAVVEGRLDVPELPVAPRVLRPGPREPEREHRQPLTPAEREELISDLADLLSTKPDVVILSRGVDLLLRVPQATIDFARLHVATVLVLQSEQAVVEYNRRIERERVVALVHSTC